MSLDATIPASVRYPPVGNIGNQCHGEGDFSIIDGNCLLRGVLKLRNTSVTGNLKNKVNF